MGAQGGLSLSPSQHREGVTSQIRIPAFAVCPLPAVKEERWLRGGGNQAVQLKGCPPLALHCEDQGLWRPTKERWLGEASHGERGSLHTFEPFTIPYCIGCVTAYRRLDKFRMILLELPARHRQSLCVMGCTALSSVGTTCPLHKIHCTPGLAKRLGSEQIWSLR